MLVDQRGLEDVGRDSVVPVRFFGSLTGFNVHNLISLKEGIMNRKEGLYAVIGGIAGAVLTMAGWSRGLRQSGRHNTNSDYGRECVWKRCGVHFG